MIKTRIGFVGAGNMSQALIAGFLKSKCLTPKQLIGMDPSAEAQFALSDLGIRIMDDLDLMMSQVDVVIIAVKPQVSDSVLAEMGSRFKSRDVLLLSLMAGVTTKKIETLVGECVPVIRCMPQTLVSLGMGSCAICRGMAATSDQMDQICRLLKTVGKVVEVREDQMDAVTGLSGSGPAYIYKIIDALVDGGVRAGLPRDVAFQLAAQTVAGAAQMLLEGDLDPSELISQVTSPGGTTIAGLQVMEAGEVSSSLADAVYAASERSKELGNS